MDRRTFIKALPVLTDRSVRDDFRKGIETAAKDLQGWYGKQLGGPAFRLNDPVVEVAKSDKDANEHAGGRSHGRAYARRHGTQHKP